jgi:hypothetical protein
MYLNYLRRKVVFRLEQKFNAVHSFDEIADNANTLLVTARHELAETQIYPFYYYRDYLKRNDVHHVEMPISRLIAELEDPLGRHPKPNRNIRRIFFQHGFMMPGTAIAQILDTLSTAFPEAHIAFMDWFAPLHIRYATVAAPYIDTYIKKQVYRDYTQFSQPTLGDTNLNDYYARRFNIGDEPMQYSPPPGFADKLMLGSNFGLSPQMVDYFLNQPPPQENRDIDLHARIAVNGVAWYKAMRQEAKNAVKRLQDTRNINIAAEGRVRRYKFFAEMRRSKLCFSPFGYGEVCWRDYEAFATGALLLKPDMDHLMVTPEVFSPGKTYVPLRWDLEDFEDKVDYYLRHDDERRAICDAAFHLNREFLMSDEIPRQITGIVHQ